MNAITATAGTPVIVTLVDGTTIAGDFISVNSKGVNVKVDGKTVSRGLNRVTSVTEATTPDSADDLFAGYNDDDALTTAALAAIFGTTAKALRVGLRATGLGVGKGRVYNLTPADVRPIADTLRSNIPTV